MKRTHRLIALTLSSLLLLSSVACGGDSSNDPESSSTETRDTLNVGLCADPMNLDPNDNNSQHVQRVKTQIYETLVARDQDGNLVGGLAESWEWEDDQTILFHIRDDFGDALVAFVLQKAFVQIELGIFLYLDAHVIELLYGRVARHEVLRTGTEGDYF